MDFYIANNYSKCSKNFSYYTTKQYMTNVLHIIGCISTPIGILGFYLILNATPKKLASVKIVMFHAHACSVHLDLIISLLVTPYLFLPACAGQVLGIYEKIGVPFKISIFLGQFSILLFGIAVIMLFENRHHSVSIIRCKMTKPIHRYIFFTFQYIFGIALFSLYYFEEFDTEQVKLKYLKIVPCPRPEYFEYETGVLTTDVMQISIICLILCVNIFALSLFFAAHCAYHLVYSTDSNVSKRTREMQMKFLRNVVIQVLIPFAAIIIPVVSVFLQMLFGQYNQAFNNNLIIGLSFHGLASNVTIICIHRSYRLETIRLFTGEFLKNVPQPSVTISVSRRVISS